MKRAALLPLLLAASACHENIAHDMPPMDRFTFPAGVALTAVAGGNQALVVVSANFDLRYDKQEGATVLSVDPALYDPATGAGGSLGRTDGALLKLGPGAQLGSYAGPVAIADEANCPGAPGGPAAFVASRYTRKLYRSPIAADGSIAPCELTRTCEFDLDLDLLDPAPVGVACRADGLRRSLWVSYLRTPPVGRVAGGTAWLSEFDLGDIGKPPRSIFLSPGPIGAMAFDAETDRLYAVGRFAGLTAPLFILDLPPCPQYAEGCSTPRVQTVDLYPNLRGAELVGIALSNPQPGRPRLAYVSARLYDEGFALATRSRPSFDVGGALLVVEIQENVVGEPLARIRQVVPIGLGAGMVTVLPARPGLGDLVVVPSSGDGTVQVFDDEVHTVVRVVAVDERTGAPEVGHFPFALASTCSVPAAAPATGCDQALVYVASFGDWTVSALQVPMANPSSADLLRAPPVAGSSQPGIPLKIGSPRP